MSNVHQVVIRMKNNLATQYNPKSPREDIFQGGKGVKCQGGMSKHNHNKLVNVFLAFRGRDVFSERATVKAAAVEA